MKKCAVMTLLLAVIILTPVLSVAQECEQLLKLVETYPKEKLYELVQKAPQSCKLGGKEKIFNDRRVIIDYDSRLY